MLGESVKDHYYFSSIFQIGERSFLLNLSGPKKPIRRKITNLD